MQFFSKSPMARKQFDIKWSTIKKSHFARSAITWKMWYLILPFLETTHLCCHNRSAHSLASVTEITGIPGDYNFKEDSTLEDLLRSHCCVRDEFRSFRHLDTKPSTQA